MNIPFNILKQLNPGLESDRPGAFSKADLKDSERDLERLKPDETTIDLPEVKDIPGQEHIHVLPLGELADTTISSDDEEGVGLLDVLNEEEIDEDLRTIESSDSATNDRTLFTEVEASNPSTDQTNLKRASLDSTDFDGEQLNEKSFQHDLTGSDLDVPGEEADDENENIGEEDEENNSYSLGSDKDS